MFRKRYFWVGFLFLSLLLGIPAGCSKQSSDPDEIPSGHIVIRFQHHVDGNPLIQYQYLYTNEAGNDYQITEVKYFISDITLYKTDGSQILIHEWQDIFYIDQDIPATQTIRVFDDIPAGTYDSISFIFGIPEEKNQSFMYVNPPEVYMSWPEILGGGYHYMMINGKWKTGEIDRPFDFHMGIGQIYKGDTINTDSIVGYVQNYFRVSLPKSSFTIQQNTEKEMTLVMHIDSWFTTPHVYDHNQWGGDIMQKQPAMQMAKENGFDVFQIIF